MAQGGILGLWRGCWPNVQVAAFMDSILVFLVVVVVVVDKWPVFPVFNSELQRAALVNLGDLSTYDR